jgi:hypothetical protein
MRPILALVFQPDPATRPGVAGRIALLKIKQLVTQSPAEGLHVAVLPPTTRLHLERPDFQRRQPQLICIGDESGPFSLRMHEDTPNVMKGVAWRSITSSLIIL